MKQQRTLHSFIRTPGALRLGLLFGIPTALIVYLIIFGFHFHPSGFFWSLAIGIAYAFVMSGVQGITGRLMMRRLPLNSRRAVLIHTLVQALSMTASFVLVTLLFSFVPYFGFTAHRETMIVIGLTALAASLTGNGFYYLDLFHRRTGAAEQEAVRAELGALRARIDPHFLFNSLNSIAALVRTAPEQAEHVTESLADLFRYSLYASGRESVTLREELDSVETYLAIERTRFGDRLETELNIPSDLRSIRMPSLLLQPLVENAVKHGVQQTPDICRITIEADREGSTLRLCVTDTGPGFSQGADIFEKGTGLSNIRDRLHGYFRDRATMTILPNGVELRFPVDSNQSL